MKQRLLKKDKKWFWKCSKTLKYFYFCKRQIFHVIIVSLIKFERRLPRNTCDARHWRFFRTLDTKQQDKIWVWKMGHYYVRFFFILLFENKKKIKLLFEERWDTTMGVLKKDGTLLWKKFWSPPPKKVFFWSPLS